MKRRISPNLLTVAGFALLAVGVYFIKTIEDSHGILRTLPYLSFGLGCSIFGHGMGDIITRSLMKGNPAAAKKMEIDKKDERNLAIANRAKAKTYDMTILLFGALILAFSLMDIDKETLWILVASYLFIHGYGAYCRVKYVKEM
ncbi:hypothetical protein GZH47_00995 [Paenibacillus rhizovicinus]|uniref:DUF2178 domain-containing protein n=1 Tax=Paenibacillus rhizovicinus TaxID=2704463 RepID=A0A6C0NTQ3_9BACL|nr:hypothetical protein [Paenibacillus rhizovicinus]QHW29545.1 hypothetical protein GZH47_00995 [Paenibacillus rhizovicinus]